MRFEIKKYREISSTQDKAKELALHGCAEWTVVVSDIQLKGRGRLKRKWVSGKGGLYFSIVLYPEINDMPLLLFKSAISICDAIRKLGIKAELKWPNDVLVDGKKICGILLESSISTKLNYGLLGIGVNVNNAIGKEINQTATSIKRELKEEISADELLNQILYEFNKNINLTDKKTIEEWKKRNCTLGKKVMIKTPDKSLSGVAFDITDEGSLLLKESLGEIRKVTVGDVSLQPSQKI